MWHFFSVDLVQSLAYWSNWKDAFVIRAITKARKIVSICLKSF